MAYLSISRGYKSTPRPQAFIRWRRYAPRFIIALAYDSGGVTTIGIRMIQTGRLSRKASGNGQKSHLLFLLGEQFSRRCS